MQFGPGFLPTFLYYFATTAIVFTLVVAKGTGAGMDTGLPQQVGAIGGVVAGLIGAYFNQTKTISVKFQNQKTFLKQLEQALNQMGYQQVAEEDGIRIYERLNLAKWLSGKIYVQLEQNTATIASRATHIRGLQKIQNLS